MNRFQNRNGCQESSVHDSSLTRLFGGQPSPKVCCPDSKEVTSTNEQSSAKTGKNVTSTSCMFLEEACGAKKIYGHTGCFFYSLIFVENCCDNVLLDDDVVILDEDDDAGLVTSVNWQDKDVASASDAANNGATTQTNSKEKDISSQNNSTAICEAPTIRDDIFPQDDDDDENIRKAKQISLLGMIS